VILSQVLFQWGNEQKGGIVVIVLVVAALIALGTSKKK